MENESQTQTTDFTELQSQPVQEANKEVIELSDEEKALIEAQRQVQFKLNAFREGYQRLVEETGFAWAVDLQSPLGAPKLGITKVS